MVHAKALRADETILYTKNFYFIFICIELKIFRLKHPPDQEYAVA